MFVLSVFQFSLRVPSMLFILPVDFDCFSTDTKALTDHTAALDYQPTSVPFSYTGHQEQFSYNGHQSPAPPSYSPVVIEEEDEDEIEDLTNNHADDPLYFDITGQGNRTVDAQPKSISDCTYIKCVLCANTHS